MWINKFRFVSSFKKVKFENNYKPNESDYLEGKTRRFIFRAAVMVGLTVAMTSFKMYSLTTHAKIYQELLTNYESKYFSPNPNDQEAKNHIDFIKKEFGQIQIQKWLSTLVNQIADSKNKFLYTLLVYLYIAFYRVNLKTSERQNVNDYENLTDFFTRECDTSRLPKIDQNRLISPAEGTVIALGRITYDEFGSAIIPQIKGRDCRLTCLLNLSNDEMCAVSNKRPLHYIVIYLSPADNHRFYSPIDFKQSEITQINGFSSTLLQIFAKKMFSYKICYNFRLILHGQSPWGNMYFIPVGAQNVGRIRLTKEQSDYGNTFQFLKKNIIYGETMYNKGDEIGHFLLGSTVVMLFEAPDDFQFSVKPNDTVSIYQPLQV